MRRNLTKQLKDYDVPYVIKTSNPASSDSGYRVPTIWVNAILDTVYLLTDVTAGVATWGLIASGGGCAPPPVVYNNTDTTINLTVADLNKVWVIENASAVAVNLPSVGSSHIGYWIEIRKKGAGNLTINRADSDTIAGGTKTENLVASQTFAAIRLILETATSWGAQGTPLGSWTD